MVCICLIITQWLKRYCAVHWLRHQNYIEKLYHLGWHEEVTVWIMYILKSTNYDSSFNWNTNLCTTTYPAGQNSKTVKHLIKGCQNHCVKKNSHIIKHSQDLIPCFLITGHTKPQTECAALSESLYITSIHLLKQIEVIKPRAKLGQKLVQHFAAR